MTTANRIKLVALSLSVSAVLVGCMRPSAANCIDRVNRLNNQAYENAQVRDFKAALDSELGAIRALLLCEKLGGESASLTMRQAEMLTYAGEYAWAAGLRKDAKQYVSRAIRILEEVRSSGALSPADLDVAISDEKTAKAELAGDWPYVKR